MIQTTIKSNIRFPDFDFSDDLQTIAKKIVIPDIVDGIDKSMAINGGALPDNAPSTKRYKARLGLGDKPLIATGKLRKSFIHKSAGKNRVKVSISNIRKDIAEYLQIQGVGSRRKKYLFFGISKDANERAVRYLKNRIKVLTHG